MKAQPIKAKEQRNHGNWDAAMFNCSHTSNGVATYTKTTKKKNKEPEILPT